MFLFDVISNVLRDEIEKIRVVMKNLLENEKIREYRDAVISYEKLITVSGRIQNEIDTSQKDIDIFKISI